MSSIEWAEPPASGSNRTGTVFTAEVVAALRANPGRWALVKKSHRGRAVAALFAKRHPEFEATTRKQPGGMFDIYARYVGEVQS